MVCTKCLQCHVRAFEIFLTTSRDAGQVFHRIFKEIDGFDESEFRCDG
jgi:hypothetical protein